MLVEAPVVRIEGEKLEHDAVLVVFVRIGWRVHEGGNELVETVAVGERRAKLRVVDGNVVPVTPVLGVVPRGNIRACHLEHVLRIIHVGVSANPLRHHLLHAVSVHELLLLEDAERVRERLLMHVGVTDSHHQGIDELVVILPVHGIEQGLHGGVNTMLRRVWNPLLEVVGAVEPYLSENCRVVSCHVQSPV